MSIRTLKASVGYNLGWVPLKLKSWGIFFILPGLLFMPNVGWGDNVLPVIQFSIKPRLCVLSEGEEVCEDELEIKWISKTRRSLCLHRNDTGKPLHCWEHAFSGSHHVEISASRNVEFQLKEMDNQELLVTEAFEVVQDNTKYRRRRRNAWSFF